MKLPLKPLIILFGVIAVPMISCSKVDTQGVESGQSVKQSLNERDLRDISSGPAVKIYPLAFEPDDPEIVGGIKGTRPETASFATFDTAVVVAVADCVNLPIIIHSQSSHSNRFITFPSIAGAENNNHTIDLRLVSCIQERSGHYFVASVLGPKSNLPNSPDVQAEWELGEIPGDINPFRSLHAQTH